MIEGSFMVVSPLDFLNNVYINITKYNLSNNDLSIYTNIDWNSIIYPANCNIIWVLYNKRRVFVYPFKLDDLMVFNNVSKSFNIDISRIPSESYYVTYYIKCGYLYFLPDSKNNSFKYPLHFSLNPIGSLIYENYTGNLSKGLFKIYVNNEYKDMPYLNKIETHISGATLFYAPLLYSRDISFETKIEKGPVDIKIYQCLYNDSCTLIYSKKNVSGYFKEFISLKYYKPSERYTLKIYVYNPGTNRLVDYWQYYVVILGNYPIPILAYLTKNETHVIFKVIDPNLKSNISYFNIKCDNNTFIVKIPLLVRENYFDLIIDKECNRVCINNTWCYTFNLSKFKNKINLFEQELNKAKTLIKNQKEKNKENNNISLNENISNITNNMNVTVNKNNTKFSYNLFYIIVFVILMAILIIYITRYKNK